MRRFYDQLTATETHPCGTDCCLAGWIVNCSPDRKKLMQKYGPLDADEAAIAVCKASGIDIDDSVFYNGEGPAMAWLREGGK